MTTTISAIKYRAVRPTAVAALAAAGVLCASARSAFSAVPTAGIEWEFEPKRIQMTSMNRNKSFVDPENVSPQAVMCTKGTGLSGYPLVSITWDNGDENGRVLEIVTAPLTVDDEMGDNWKQTLKTVDRFIKGVQLTCIERNAPTGEEVCAASWTEVVSHLNKNRANGDLEFVINKNDTDGEYDSCGREKKSNNYSSAATGYIEIFKPWIDVLSRGDIKNIMKEATFPHKAVFTQVNLGIRLADLWDKRMQIARNTSLLDLTSTGARAYSKSRGPLSSYDSSMDSNSKAFMMLVAMGMSVIAWRDAQPKPSSVSDADVKNEFSMLPKTPLGQIWTALPVAGRRFIFNEFLQQPEKMNPLCSVRGTADCGAQSNRFARAFTEGHDPFALGKPIGLVRDNSQQPVVVMEFRSNVKFVEAAGLRYVDGATNVDYRDWSSFSTTIKNIFTKAD